MRLTLGVVPSFLLGLLLCSLLSAADPSDDNLEKNVTVQRDETIWLFNGKDLQGWDFYSQDGKDKTRQDTTTKPQDVWSVSNGVLRCEGLPIGYLRTKKKYENFILELQWRWPEDSQPGNSGVLLRAYGREKVWPKSVEAQLKVNNAGDIYLMEDFVVKPVPGRSDGRRTPKLHESNENPQGQWNDYRIVVDGDRLTLEVNGLLQNRVTGVERVAGWIALQSEGRPIEFRNLRLTPLKEK